MGATLALLALPLGVAVPAVAAPAPTSIVAASHATAVTPSAVSRVVSGAVSSAAATAAPGVARGDDPAQVLEALSLALTNKFLHGSRHVLQSHGGDDRERAELLSRILPEPRR